MVVCAGSTCLNISESADLQGFSEISIFRVYRECFRKKNVVSGGSVCENALLIPEGQRRMARLV